MVPLIIDTNLIAELRDPLVVRAYVSPYLLAYGRLTICRIVYLEVRQGLLALKNGRDRVKAFNKVVQRQYEVLELDYRSACAAAEVFNSMAVSTWKRKRIQRSKLQAMQRDILIAGIALANGYGIATRDLNDFALIPGFREGVNLFDWKQAE